VGVETWVVGAEHDEALFLALGAALRKLGCTLEDDAWGVAGSQELSRWVLESSLGQLVVEAETYVGLSVSGPGEAVSALRLQMAQVRSTA
jgi:hypothetical protein